MHSILSVVTSLNGLTTRGKEGPYSWASPEDQKKFADLKSQSDVVAMGPNTYRDAREAIFTNLTNKPMRAVISRGENFRLDTVPDKLEFFSSIEEFLTQMEKRGRHQILWAGGAKLNGELFRKGLIDEVHQTVEPVYFGSGLPIAEGISTVSLQKQAGYPVTLNEKGTLYIAYDVLKNK